ncbi:hypothetical protein JXB22_10275 [candidate division WOR-3 bacterium]|nr:hypothetical protein [candidate division WOR-3 bacterium]
MKSKEILACVLLLGMLSIRCEPEYFDRYLYIAVAGDYDIPFTGSFGDQYSQQDVHSQTPDYYYFHLSDTDNRFIGEFAKSITEKKDFRCLSVRLYLKEFPKASSLLVEASQEHPESTIVVTYRD